MTLYNSLNAGLFAALRGVALVALAWFVAAGVLVSASQAALVANWHFDGNYVDSSGLGNHLTPVNTPTFGTAIAPFGSQALNTVFSPSQYAVNTAPNGLNFTSAYSVSGWVKAPLQGTNGHRGIFYRGNGASRADIEFYVQQTTNEFVVAHNRNSGVSQAFDFTSFPKMPNDIAYYLTVTYDGTVARTYYNGVEQGFIQGYNNVTGTVTPNFTAGNNILVQPLVSPSYQVRMGSVPDLSAGFTGALDEFKVFNTVLSQLEIDNLFLFNSTVAPIPAPEPSTMLLLVLGTASCLVRRRRQSGLRQAV